MILSFIIKSPENQRSDDFQDNVPNQKKTSVDFAH